MNGNHIRRILALLLVFTLLIPMIAISEEIPADGVVNGEAIGAITLQPEEIISEQVEDPVLEMEGFQLGGDGQANVPTDASPSSEGEGNAQGETPSPMETDDSVLLSDDSSPTIEEEGDIQIEASSSIEAEASAVLSAADSVSKSGEESYQPVHHTFNIQKNSKANMNIDDTAQVYVTSGTVKSWSSSKKTVADCTFNGDYATVRAYSAGTAKLTATLTNKKKITLTITVSDPYLPSSVSFAETEYIMAVGDAYDVSQDIELSPVYARTTYTWSSSKTSIAKVDKNGKVTAVKPGNATITVTTKNKKKATVKITVLANKLTNMNPKPTSSDYSSVSGGWSLWPLSIEVLSNGGITCEFYLLNGTGQTTSQVENMALSLAAGSPSNKVAQYTFSNTKISCKKNAYKSFKVTFPASSVLNKGIFFPDYTGSVYFNINTDSVRLKAGKSYFDFIPTKFPVNDPGTVAVTGVTISQPTGTVKVNNTLTLTAQVSPSNATEKGINWSSADNSIATVSNGVVTGKKAGTVKITATAVGNSSKSASCTVTVEPATSQEVTVTTGNNSISIADGKETLCKFVVPSAGTYVFTTTGSKDTLGVLYNASKSKLAENDDISSSDRNFKIEYALTNGQVVYIGVKYYSTSDSGTATLSISKKNTTVKPATPVFNLSASGNSINVTWSAASGASRYSVYYGTSNAVENSTTLSQSITALNATISNLNYNTTYYVWVYATSSDGTVCDAPSPKSIKTGAAPEVTVSTGSNSVSIAAGKETLCKFVAPSAGTYVFTTTGSKDTIGALYNASKSKLTENDDISSSDRNFKIVYNLTNGQTVYIGVKYYSTTDSGNVTLVISKDTPSFTVTHASLSNNVLTMNSDAGQGHYSTLKIKSNRAWTATLTNTTSGFVKFTSTGSTATVNSETSASGAASDNELDLRIEIKTTPQAGTTSQATLKFSVDGQTYTYTIKLTKPAVQEPTVTTGNNSVAMTAGKETLCKFVAPSAGTYIFTTTGSKDTLGVLYNSSKSKLTENDDISSSNRNFKIVYNLTNGQTVYIGVKYYSTSESGNVTLSISKEALSFTVSHDSLSNNVLTMNSDAGQGHYSTLKIKSNKAWTATLTNNTSNFVKFTSTGSTATINSETSASGAASDNDVNLRIEIKTTPQAGTTSQATLKFSVDGQTYTYTIKLTKPAAPEPTVTTGNNSVPMTAGKETLCKFVAPSAGTYIFTTTGSKDTLGVLYNSSKSKLTENDDISSSNRNFKIEYNLTNGQTVYIGVKYYNTSESGNVTLSISKKSTTNKLSAPTGVKVDATTNSTASVSFNSVNGASGYYLYYSTSNSFSTSNNKVTADASKRVGYVSGLSSGRTYYFWVAAFDSNGTVGYESSQVSTITGKVSLTIRKGSSSGGVVSDGDYIDWPINQSFFAACSQTNGNGKYLTKAFVMSSKPKFDNTDVNSLVTGVAYNGTGYYYGRNGNDEFGQNTMNALPFDFTGCSVGQYVKIWIAAEDVNYASNDVKAGIQFALRLTGTGNVPSITLKACRISGNVDITSTSWEEDEPYISFASFRAGDTLSVPYTATASKVQLIFCKGSGNNWYAYDENNAQLNQMKSSSSGTFSMKLPTNIADGEYALVLIAENSTTAVRLRICVDVYSGSTVLRWPLDTKFHIITSEFNRNRLHPILHVNRSHNGMDIGDGGINGTYVYAAADGEVTFAGLDGTLTSGAGYMVKIKHDDSLATVYMHMQKDSLLVKNGQRVSKGTKLGLVGMTGYATGPHLHFEVHLKGTKVNPRAFVTVP